MKTSQFLLMVATCLVLYLARDAMAGEERTKGYHAEHKEPKIYCMPWDKCWPSYEHVQELKYNLTGELLQEWGAVYKNMTRLYNTRVSRKPSFVVVAANRGDIQKAVAFAAKHNISITVSSGAHCFIGRSSADFSLLIKVSNMKAITTNMDDKRSKTGYSVELESGNTWGRVYAEVDKVGKVVVGPNARTVGVGGYILGGGISPLSPMLGLAVDNVIEMSFVTADGAFRRCTDEGCLITYPNGTEVESAETDIYWAMRGGGGSTFAVLVTVTVQMHDAPPGTSQAVVLWPASVAENVINLYGSFIQFLTKKCGGYILAGTSEKGPYLMISLVYWGGYEEAYDVLRPLMEIERESQIWHLIKNFTTFNEYALTMYPTEYERGYIINRFLDEKDLGPPFTDFIVDHVLESDIPDLVCVGALVGQQVSMVPIDDLPVSEGLRKSRLNFGCYAGWKDEDDDHWFLYKMHKLSKPLYELGMQMYVNEPDEMVDDWQTEYFAPQYGKLSWIKYKYDPNSTFGCYKCVGYNAAQSIARMTPFWTIIMAIVLSFKM